MPSRYNLRSTKERVVWVNDGTVADASDDDDDDEDWTPSVGDESEEDTYIQIPKHTKVSINVNIHARPESEDESETDSEDEMDGNAFLDYLATKYAGGAEPATKKRRVDKRTRSGSDVVEEKPAIALNEVEMKYYKSQPSLSRRLMNDDMQKLAAFLVDESVPQKFRVLALGIPDRMKAILIRKIDTLNEMEPNTGDYYKMQTWVEGFLRIPFGNLVQLPIRYDLNPTLCAEFMRKTRTILDESVFAMNGAKAQIMQIVAQWTANPTAAGNVIALKGPMGVGKTSFARNGVAKALQRPFEFFSLGGASDVSGFIGHSYTYEGATWGRIIDSLMNAKCMNPVFYFDELDKVSTTAHGEEIINMLIHLTDRTQNSQFHDLYFAGVDFDLSQCLFVFSFNDDKLIHPILKDRMQVIQCAGYTSSEKRSILTQYILPSMLEKLHLKDAITLTPEAEKYIIEEYSKEEEGVRGLIRSVETLLMRVNLIRVSDEETAKSYPFYMKLTLPMDLTVPHIKGILKDDEKQINESFRQMYV